MSEQLRIAMLAGASVSSGIAAASGTWLVGRALMRRGIMADARTRREAGLTDSFSGPLSVVSPLLPLASAIGSAFNLDSGEVELRVKYARAGFPGQLRDDQLYGLGLVLGLPLVLALAVILALLHPLLTPLCLIGSLVGPILLGARLESMAKARERDIHRSMPFVLDLLVLTMRAGASLQQAVDRVRIDFAREAIGQEFRAVLADLSTGATNAEAFGNFATRVPLESVRTFVDDLIQGEELGRPLAELFEGQADRARQRRVQEATETAGRAKVLVLVPGMLVFIAVLILLFAPFAVSWLYGGGMFG